MPPHSATFRRRRAGMEAMVFSLRPTQKKLSNFCLHASRWAADDKGGIEDVTEKYSRKDLPVLLLHNVDAAWGEIDVKRALDEISVMKEALQTEGHPVAEVQVDEADLENLLRPYHPDKYIVINWCEELPGLPKSDAAVAETLERLGYAYTGSPPEVLAMSWQKTAVKEALQKEGIPIPVGRLFSNDGVEGWNHYPAIVKPSREHCSLGVTPDAIVFNQEDLRRRVAYVLDEFNQPALVEDFIEGREFHASLWGNSRIEMLPPAEMDFSAFPDMKRHLCTYDSKFNFGSEDFETIKMVVPALLEEILCDRLEDIVCRTYKALGCRDFARIDLRLRGAVFFVLDVNPNPDLSSETSTAYGAEAAGITYGQFVSGLVNMAAERHRLFRRSTATKMD